MSEAPSRFDRDGWPWALALVACVYLLTMAGSWIVTDLGETLFAARRLLDRGTLELAGPDEPVPELPSLPRRPGQPLRTRLAPLTPFTLTPLLALDRLLGWEDPRPDGRFVHLQGVLATLLGLALLGGALRRSGGSPRAVALGVAMTGLTWPVWRASRRAGPEALLVLLVCVFLAGVLRRHDSGWRWLEVLACIALPWAHPTGPVVAAVLAVSLALEPGLWSARRRIARAAPALAATGLGTLSWMLIWNLGYHGDLLQGGYAAFVPAQGYAPVAPLAGLAANLKTLLPQVGPLVALAVLGYALSREAPPGAAAAPLLTAALLAMFSTFYAAEPERRLACAWPAWGALLGSTWDRLDRGRAGAGVVVAGQALLAFFLFMREEGRYFEGPAGLFYPAVLWVELLLEGASPWVVGVPVALLIAGLWVSARRALKAPGPVDASASTPAAG